MKLVGLLGQQALPPNDRSLAPPTLHPNDLPLLPKERAGERFKSGQQTDR
jgi:hypothetical protein